MPMIHYCRPDNWIGYDAVAVMNELATAKAAVLSLRTVPYQRRWVERLQQMELKREVAGTSRIEGAEFTTKELDRVMKEETPDEMYTRSQHQARAAKATYEWIAGLPVGTPVTADLVREIHRKMVTGADDDHCVPGELRGHMTNVTFGSPPHRGCEGGSECAGTFEEFANALQTVFAAHDPIVQAAAAHYHLAAMHPFLDGNGRTARAVEAFMLGRAGLRDTTFVAMSNYYYDQKPAYLAALAAVRERRNDLTPFLKFVLRGVELQAKRLLNEIQIEIKRELFRALATDLFGRLQSPRKRFLAARQMKILDLLLSHDEMSLADLMRTIRADYVMLKSGSKAMARDIVALYHLGAIRLWDMKPDQMTRVAVDLDWPSRITESEFFHTIKEMPKAKIPFAI